MHSAAPASRWWENRGEPETATTRASFSIPTATGSRLPCSRCLPQWATGNRPAKKKDRGLWPALRVPVSHVLLAFSGGRTCPKTRERTLFLRDKIALRRDPQAGRSLGSPALVSGVGKLQIVKDVQGRSLGGGRRTGLIDIDIIHGKS